MISNNVIFAAILILLVAKIMNKNETDKKKQKKFWVSPNIRRCTHEDGIMCPESGTIHCQVGIMCPKPMANHSEGGIVCLKSGARYFQVGKVCPESRA